jgi:response regulator RpfG family c-di-GMP phosphodiesterase
MHRKILIVDDEPDIVLVLRMKLEQEGYAVCEAHDGLQALDVVGQEKPDLILLDIMMPKLDGYSMNLRLKDNPDTARIPVIVKTGKGHVKELLEIRDELRVASYLEKPFPVSLLLEKIKEVFFAALDTSGNLYVSKGLNKKETQGQYGIE